MDRYQFSATSLAAMIGGRTELKRVLANDGTDAYRRVLFEKMKNSRLFSPEDYKLLEDSLKISRIGVERYRFSQQMKQLVEYAAPAEPSLVRLEGGSALNQHLDGIREADKIEIICINCCYPSVIQTLQPLFEAPEREVAMWHIFHTDTLASLPSALFLTAHPLIFDMRYHPYGMKSSSGTTLHTLGGNLLAIRAHYPAKTVQHCYLVLSEETAIEIPNAADSNMFSFIGKVLHFEASALSPLRNVPAKNDDYATLCMNYLSHELNRGTYSVSSDLCFYQTPTDIALAALLENASFPKKNMTSLVERVVAIHEQRYQNYYRKRKDTYQIMSYAGCRRFLETGLFTDHFFGFRSFTPAERKIIFGNMIAFAKENPFYVPLLLKDHDFRFKYHLFCFEKLGVCLDLTDTDYDMRKGHHSVFIDYPEFTQQYTHYYLNALCKEMCHTAEESLHLLEELYDEFLKKYNL